VLFNTLAYARFFAIVFVVAWLLSRQRRLRVVFLLLASYVFYAHWDYRFVPLIWASSTADYLLGHAIARAPDPERRKRWLVVTVIVNLGLLGFFKYFNFGIDSARVLLESLGYHPPPFALEVALPVGISFFTFESMSYVIDVYRGDIEPHPSYLEYLTFVAFFPHLVAGPIVRPRDLLPQLAKPARFRAELGSEALFLIALGLLKKVAIGDYLALNLVDRVFQAPGQYSALECYAAVVGYSLQIYCDFSGYTDIAIGSALLLGIRFPPNFAAPYTASDLIDFWRRWHISLSTWLRDYLYVPLGGNRRGPARTYANLLITMLLGGLWHGANWTFVVWGGLHGLGLALNRVLRDRFNVNPARRLGTRLLGVFVTFHFVAFGWIFFRSNSFASARAFLERLSSLTSYHPNLDGRVVAVLVVGLVTHFVPRGWYDRAKTSFCALPAAGQAVLLFGALLVLRTMASAEAVPFVYFQF
jgi:D-alanyl-lipoteichoic acid acyltransferase DltB (MBOAT superfamily)